MSSASSIHTLLPDAGFAPARKTQRLDPGCADIAEFEVAIVRGKCDRKPDIARGSAASAAHSDRHIDPAQEPLLRRFLFCRAAGTAGSFVLGEDRGRGLVLKLQQKIAGDGLEKFAFDGGVASALSPQSLENPHRVLRWWWNRQCRSKAARSLSGIKHLSERCCSLCPDKEPRSERPMITVNKRGARSWRRCRN
jgi:hypothetical protein